MEWKRWLGRQIARYEHAARRAQLPIWIVIAINTTLEVVFDTVPFEVVLFIYVVGIFGAIMIGYISDKARVGVNVTEAQFGIEQREFWNSLNWVSSARFAYCIRMEPAQLAELLDKYEKKLQIWEAKA